MSKYKVSVVMSVYNDTEYLQSSIQSILSQTFDNFEFIIVDDGSTDDSLQIIDKFNDNRISLLKQNHKGLPSALNYGISKAVGELIVRMDADDIALPDRIGKQVEFMDNNPCVSIVGGSVYLIDSDDKIIGRRIVQNKEEEIISVVSYGCPTIHPTLCFRKTFFESIGGYREVFMYAQDYDLILRAVDLKYRVTNISDILLKYRTGNTHRLEKVYKHTKLVLLAQQLHSQRDKLLDEDKKMIDLFESKMSFSLVERVIYWAYYKTLLFKLSNSFPSHLWKILNTIVCLFNKDLLTVLYNDYKYHYIMRQNNSRKSQHDKFDTSKPI